MMKFHTLGKNNKGFTLIELLVVIAIIGVLASVVLASLNNARRKSRDARRITDLKQIQLALELYFDGDGKAQYPTDIYAATGGLAPKYIQTVPRDPNDLTDTGKYTYAYPPGTNSRTTYHLGGALEDPDNLVYLTDADFDSAAAGYTGGFNGKGTGDGNPPNDPFYDLRP